MSNDKPEQYWIGRGSDVIADLTLDQLLSSRQAVTYKTISEWVQKRNVTQILDLGCNTGAVGRVLYATGYSGQYHGVDSNLHAIERAKQNFAEMHTNTSVEVANIRELPYADGSFECVTMKDVLEHMEDFRPCLASAARVASQCLILANFICWEQLPPLTVKEEGGFYHNRYNRRAVLDFLEARGWVVDGFRRFTLVTGEQNEVWAFKQGGK